MQRTCSGELVPLIRFYVELGKTISFRVKDDQGKAHDIQLRECVWYELFADGRIRVDREGIGRAEGIISADQVRQLKHLSWLKLNILSAITSSTSEYRRIYRTALMRMKK